MRVSRETFLKKSDLRFREGDIGQNRAKRMKSFCTKQTGSHLLPG